MRALERERASDAAEALEVGTQALQERDRLAAGRVSARGT
jgi:hypothetical protein